VRARGVQCADLDCHCLLVAGSVPFVDLREPSMAVRCQVSVRCLKVHPALHPPTQFEFPPSTNGAED